MVSGVPHIRKLALQLEIRGMHHHLQMVFYPAFEVPFGTLKQLGYIAFVLNSVLKMNPLIIPTFSTFIGIGSGFLSYYIQFTRNNNFVYKNKNKFLYKLVQDASSDAILELSHLERFSMDLEEDYYDIPLLTMASYNPIALLAEKSNFDEYFFAYSWTFANHLKAEDNFLSMQLSSIQARDILFQFRDMVTKAKELNHLRKKALVQLFHELVDKSNVAIQKHTEEDIVPLKKIIAIIMKFKDETFHESGSIETIFSSVILPIGNYLQMLGRMPDTLIPIAQIINDYPKDLGEIAFQGQKFQEDTKSIIISFRDAQIELKKVCDFWNANLRRYLIKY